MKRLTALIGTLLLATTACEGESGTHIGNPPATSVGFQMLVTTSHDDGGLSFEDDTGVVYQLTSAHAYVRDIEFDLPDGQSCEAIEPGLAGGARCDDSEAGRPKIVVDGPFAVDLIAGTSTPSIDDVRVPLLTYRRIDMRLVDADPDDGVVDEGDALVDRSLVARANFDYMSTPLELELSLRFNEDVRFEHDDGVAPPDDGSLLALLDVALWLDDLPIGDCLDDSELDVSGGRLVVDDDTSGGGDCSDIENTVKDNIKDSGALDAG